MYKAISKHVVILSSLLVLGGCGAADTDFDDDINSSDETPLDTLPNSGGAGGIGGSGGESRSDGDDGFSGEDGFGGGFEEEEVSEEEVSEEEVSEEEVSEEEVSEEEVSEEEVSEEVVEEDDFGDETVEEEEFEDSDSYQRRGIQVCEDFENASYSFFLQNDFPGGRFCSPKCDEGELTSGWGGCAPDEPPGPGFARWYDDDRYRRAKLELCPPPQIQPPRDIDDIIAEQTQPPQGFRGERREPVKELERGCVESCPDGWFLITSVAGQEGCYLPCPDDGWRYDGVFICERLYDQEYRRELDSECPEDWQFDGNHCYEPCDEGYEADGDRCVVSG
jgi:hypothetical protein